MGTDDHAAPLHNIAVLTDDNKDFVQKSQPYLVRVEKTENSDSYHAHGIGARIMHPLGVDGTNQTDTGWDTEQTDQQLWPWPLEAWVQAEMRTSEYTSDAERGLAAQGETLSNYIWSFLGMTAPPFNVVANPESSGIKIDWDAPVTSQLATITHYNIYDVTGISEPAIPGTITPIAMTANNTTYTHTFNNLNAGQRYDFAVTAVDSVKGETGYSYIATSTPLTVNISTPTQGFVLTPDTNGSISLAGSAPANSNVELYVNDSLTTSVTADANGSWTASLNINGNSSLGGAITFSVKSSNITSNIVSGINLISVPTVPAGVSIQLR